MYLYLIGELKSFMFAYIAQKESRFPEGRISSRRNDVNEGRAARFLAYS